ncbi:hypothetical protein [Brumimicrobium mesophilum]|uniref:hypothetical protein n=1 Tax=Brumimicrobium mesophilum TaxID=392717 RepID=UPI001F16D5DB|nr:hypothetical protein [Brumimicrobium mesophilum]
MNTNDMKGTMHINRNLINFGIPLVLLGSLILLMKSSFLNGNDSLNLAITVDLLLIIPLVYFLLIRKSAIPNTTVIPVMIVGLLVGTYFLPQESQIYLSIFKTWALPIIEISILIFVITKVRRAIKEYKKLKGSTPDFYSALKSTCYEILPKKLVLPFATEVAVFYYGFINWKKREINENEFTYHKDSGAPALFGVFIMIIGIETVALHFLLARWSIVAAWILTILSVYTAIQVFGFAKSLSKRPISINKDSLTLKYGILNEVEIPFSDIQKIELSSKSLEKQEFTKTLSPLGELESHNVIIHLKRENELVGLYGMKKKFNVLGLHIDKPVEFKEKVENTLL